MFFLAAPLPAQSYGSGEQTLTIGAVDFKPRSPEEPAGYGSYLGPDGYVSTFSDVPSVVGFESTLDIPDGSEIEEVCVFSRGDGIDVITVSLRAVKLVPQGEAAAAVDLPGAVITSNPVTGYARGCTGPLALTVRATSDVDGDGALDHVSYRVDAAIQNQQPEGAGLGAVQVVWRRQVSPPPAMPTFADVPETDGGFSHVEALVASGITAGCGGGSYCPDAALTRRQMAVFLAKALGLDWRDP